MAGGVLRSGGQVVDNGRTLGFQVVDCMFLVERKDDEAEEESSQATTLQFGSPAKGRYVCPMEMIAKTLIVLAMSMMGR